MQILRSVDRITGRRRSETVFMELSEKPDAVTEEQISVIERFIGFGYFGRCINSIDSEGMRDFEYSLHKDLPLIPPSRSGLKEPIRRVENVCLLSPFDWSRRYSNELFMPLRHSSDVAIDADSLTATCACSSQKCINANVLHFHTFHFASVREIVSTNLFRVYSFIFSDFVNFSGVFIVCKYCYSLLKCS